MSKIFRFLLLPIILSIIVTPQLYAAFKPGDFALDFKLQDLQNNTVTLSAYKNKQPVLVFFWTTWCPYCRRALRDINDLSQKLSAKGWEILAIDTGEPAEKVKKFTAGYALNFKVLLDEDMAASDAYDVLGVPTYVLVDKNGLIIFKDNYFPKDLIEEVIP